GDQPLRRFDTQAGARLDIARIVLGPELMPAGVDEDGVAGLQLGALLLEGSFEILHRDLVAVAQRLNALVGRHVDQHPAGEERARLMYTKLAEAGPRRRLADLETVVEAVLVALVRKAVELSAHLADLGEHHLLVGAALVRPRVHERALDVHVEAAGTKE